MLNEKKKAAGTIASAILAAMLALATAPAALGATDVTEEFADVKAGAWYAANVQWAYDGGYITGYTDGSGEWGVGDPVTRAQLAAMLARHAGADTSSKRDATGISDLKKGGQWYTGAVNWAVSEGVITGYTDKSGNVTAFGPNDELSREQAATILARYAAKNGVDTSASLGVLNVFPDKSKISSWSDDSVAWIVSQGIMSGYSAGAKKGLFGPADDVLREQMAKMLQGAVAVIEEEGDAAGGSGSGSGGGGSDGAAGDAVEGDGGSSSGSGSGSGTTGDAGGSGSTGGSDGGDTLGSYDPYDLASGVHKVVWTGSALWWTDYVGYGKVTRNTFEQRVEDPLGVVAFHVHEVQEDGSVIKGSGVPASCDRSVTYDPGTRRYTVTYTPKAGDTWYSNVLTYTTPTVPHVNRVCYAGVKMECGHAAHDEEGRVYATYLADSPGSLASEHFDVRADDYALSVELYLKTYGTGNPNGYGEREDYLEGRSVKEVWADCASKWRGELEYFNCGNDDDLVTDYVLIAPWNLDSGKAYHCNHPSCENYQKAGEAFVSPIHSRSAHVWASGN